MMTFSETSLRDGFFSLKGAEKLGSKEEILQIILFSELKHTLNAQRREFN